MIPGILFPTAPGFDKLDARSARSRLTDHYADAFTDTYGTVSGAPFVYKTGHPWPKRVGGPEAQPFIRETRPVHGHAITLFWPKFLKETEAYLNSCLRVKFIAITGFGFANPGEKVAFCPLLVTIGVPPNSLEFVEAKTAADYVKDTILSPAGFGNIDVAVREWTTSLSGRGPKLPSLDPLIDLASEFSHPFTSTLGLYVAPLKTPHFEGTIGLYLRRRSDSNDVLALTAAHVARPPPKYPNTGLRETHSIRHPEEIIALGNEAYQNATTSIMSGIGTLHDLRDSSKQNITTLREEQRKGTKDAVKIAKALRVAEENVVRMTEKMDQLDSLHSQVTKFMTTANQRPIGFVLHADPIGVSDEPDGHTIDWAVIKLDEDAFDWSDFKGNQVYIGDKIKEGDYVSLMYPNSSDRAGYKLPPNGILQIYGSIPEDEIRNPQQLNAHGDKAMPVIKNGLTTGTTVGWVNGLKSLVRYHDYNLDFTALETTILPYGGRGAFSNKGDSGAIILDRGGRIVALLTGGGGLTGETDVTFSTAWYELEPHIKKTLPGCQVYSAVN